MSTPELHICTADSENPGLVFADLFIHLSESWYYWIRLQISLKAESWYLRICLQTSLLNAIDCS